MDEQEVEAFPSVSASAVEPPVSEEPVQQLDPPVSRALATHSHPRCLWLDRHSRTRPARARQEALA